jgi:hypothetical protein
MKEFNWNTAPLPEAQRRLAEIKEIYDRAAQVVLSRQSRLPVTYRCWVQFHKPEVPASVVRQCRNEIPDGKWVFRDDGCLDSKGRPSVCCSIQCYTVYGQYQSDKKYKAKLAVAAAEGGSAPPGVDLEAEE